MKKLFYSFFLLLIFLIPFSCNGQSSRAITKTVGGPCEGCEAINEYGNKKLNPVDTLPLYNSTSSELKISGTVYQQDGKTPKKDVILCIYHTNRQGIYPIKGNEEGWVGQSATALFAGG